MPTMPPQALTVGDTLDGFRVESVTPLPFMYAIAYTLAHPASGARLLHLHADDPENLFSVSFPTPPPDDTGLPHILEHSVLAGSQRFPVKEPFFELIKMSMATFINAMTGWDCTYYPVSSTVKTDLFNLAEVYFDAVFHPLLTPQTFRREAHHLAPADPAHPTDGLTINGIVYNEMKGAYSNPEARLYRLTTRGLFPDTPYGRESGGDPDAIPDLTYQQLQDYHRVHYHPSNAYFFLYGDIPTREHLAFLRDRLAPFTAIPGETGLRPQPRWAAPRTVQDVYPIEPTEPIEGKTFLVLQWLVGDATDPADAIRLRVLSLLLLGNEGAPLKKAVIDSHLGEDLIASGDSSVGLENTFRIGIKGAEPDRLDAFRDLVLATLQRCAADDFDPDRVDAAFHQAAYQYLEIHPMFPLHAMEHVMQSWIYGCDPLDHVRMREHLQTVRQEYEADRGRFGRLIRERLLDNPHRLDARLAPDRQWQKRKDAELADKMRALRATLTDDQARRIAADAAELDRLNAAPNLPEAIATLPQLRAADLPPHVVHVPTSTDKLPGNADLLRCDVFAGGVSYLHLNFDLTGLPPHLWPYVGRYADLLSRLGAAGMDYECMSSRIARYTGGVGCGTSFTTAAAAPTQGVWGLRLSLKAVDDRIAPALSVLHDLLFSVDPADRARLKDVLVQSRARLRTGLVHGGSSTAARHAARGLDPEGYLGELTGGLPQLDLSERLAKRFDELSDEAVSHLLAVRDFLLNRRRLTACFTGADAPYATVRSALTDWASAMRDEPVEPADLGFTPFPAPPREGLAGPVQVAHCQMLIPAPHSCDPVNEPLLRVGSHLVSLDYILSEVRFQGNAYGAWCRYDSARALLHLGSYNDPHVARTLKVFADTLDFVRRAPWSREDVERAIIGSAKYDHRPLRPAEATGAALYRHLTGWTPELREQRYERMKAATAPAIRESLLATLTAGLPQAPICVMSNREKLESANREMPDAPLAIRDILSNAEQG